MNRIPSHLISHYIRLGLSGPATRSEISAAYRAAALKHHPDKGGSAPTFAAITDSYNSLMRAVDRDFHPSHHGQYRPASLRSFVDSQRTEPSPFTGILTAIVVPSLIGILVGIRMVYFGGERTGLRAGGNSKFTDDEINMHSSQKSKSAQELRNEQQQFRKQQIERQQQQNNKQ